MSKVKTKYCSWRYIHKEEHWTTTCGIEVLDTDRARIYLCPNCGKKIKEINYEN